MGRLSAGTAPWNYTDIPDSSEPNDPPADFMRLAVRTAALLQGIGNRLTILESDTGWVVSGVATASAGWAVEAQSARRRGKWASVHLSISRTGAAISVTPTGDIANVEVAILSTAWRPHNVPADLVNPGLSVATVGRVGAFAALRSTGAVVLGAVGGSGDIPSGATFTIGGSWWVA